MTTALASGVLLGLFCGLAPGPLVGAGAGSNAAAWPTGRLQDRSDPVGHRRAKHRPGAGSEAGTIPPVARHIGGISAMNPFPAFPTCSKPLWLRRFAARSTLIMFLLCLAGLAAVVWRSKEGANAAHAHGRWSMARRASRRN
jgi:hypothetical protein